MTALVTSAVPFSIRKKIADEIMKTEAACEQVGFLSFNDCVELDMTGGEFCGNAVMCAAAAGFLKDKSADTVNSGQSMKVRICGAEYQVNVLQLSSKDFECKLFTNTVPEGIKHTVVEGLPEKKQAEAEIKALPGEEAKGMMFLNGTDLIPLVYVPKADTLFWENSCASGSLAVGQYLYEKTKKPVDVELSMPGGKLSVKCDEGGLVLKEKIRIVSETSLFVV